ncbi:hypothetical protein [Candidatus Liberibacter americanus]|uniref:Uncharacterized protein n=1 Tax=Candidatus Liberibacter americanus str. Sao Paulo TaxID=1261131 RepID=U6B321_9HYPH|nr:hypothetical protein [Candidatus Liberibacter americanus]AHA27459.1 hypothetical protein lam_076 [Candidatus Liberibacter americanus str. Sao Paulo]EMS36580.1 hypothetical protein G653_01447 [Candidatus Liberibacter americanus PW_SP]
MGITEIKNSTVNTDSVIRQRTDSVIGHVCSNNTDCNSNNNIKQIENSTIKNILEIAKNAAINSIPIYGTIQAFKKGETKWGIFGIVTDVLTLVPIIGIGSKLIGSVIKAGSITTKFGRTMKGGKASIELKNVTSSIIKESNAEIKTEYIPRKIIKEEGNISIKKETVSVNSINAENVTIHSEKNSNINKKIAKSFTNIADQKLTSLYNEGKIIYKKGEKIGDKVSGKVDVHTKDMLPYTVKSAPSKYFAKTLKTIKQSKWQPANLSKYEDIMLKEYTDIMFKDFKDLGNLQLSDKFIRDAARSKYEINGKIGTPKNPEKTIKLIKEILSKDPKKAQLISAFANQSIFFNISNHLRKNVEGLAGCLLKNRKIIYKIDTMHQDTVKITAKYDADILRAKKTKIFDNSTKEIKFKKYGLKMEMTLSEDKVIEAKPYVYVS